MVTVTANVLLIGPSWSAKVIAKVTHSPKAVALFAFYSNVFIFGGLGELHLHIYVYVDRVQYRLVSGFVALHSVETFTDTAKSQNMVYVM